MSYLNDVDRIEEINDDFRHIIFNKKISDMTNSEFLYYLMEIGGRTGAMKQLFIMDAIPKWCKYVIDHKDEVLNSMNMTILDGPSWIAAAEEIIEMFDKKYESGK